MRHRTRRQFIRETGLFAAAGLVGCRPATDAPLVVSRVDRRVTRLLPGIPTADGAGVRLTRIVGHPALREIDPFLLLDFFHSDRPDDYIRGFPDHPHRGFETVTVMMHGRMRHRDSVGNAGIVEGGGSQWMTAGRGIIHSEMPEQERGLMSGFQLWVNLPAKAKMTEPYYQDLAAAEIAEARLSAAGSRMRITAGNVDGLEGPVRERPTDPTLITLVLEDDTPFVLDTPTDYTAIAYAFEGEVAVGPDDDARLVGEGRLAVLGEGHRVTLRARHRRSEVFLAVARPLHEPIARRGPFVMNTEAEIRQAYADLRAGRLALP